MFIPYWKYIFAFSPSWNAGLRVVLVTQIPTIIGNLRCHTSKCFTFSSSISQSMEFLGKKCSRDEFFLKNFCGRMIFGNFFNSYFEILEGPSIFGYISDKFRLTSGLHRKVPPLSCVKWEFFFFVQLVILSLICVASDYTRHIRLNRETWKQYACHTVV